MPPNSEAAEKGSGWGGCGAGWVRGSGCWGGVVAAKGRPSPGMAGPAWLRASSCFRGSAAGAGGSGWPRPGPRLPSRLSLGSG